ncbi:MAG: hypothetical protein U5R14_00195 [Gemmatimonadota bacterium]|nr:hypothetical protein [Gemmatimonadota bacterium]
MNFSITVRYGDRAHRYHTFEVAAEDARAALVAAAKEIPDEIAPLADLVELRVSVDPEERNYLE